MIRSMVDHVDSSIGPPGCTVRLCQATLPQWSLRACAVHSWFECHDPRAGPRWWRWEVWQHAYAGGQAWGHLHRDLMRIGADVGGGSSRILACYLGAAAQRLIDVLDASPGTYPYRQRYRAWPGPNSNTFAAWVLERSAIPEPCDGRAVGADYTATWRRRREAQCHGFHGPLAGLRWSLAFCGGQILGLRFQLLRQPWRLLTPLGDIGRRSQPHPQGRQAQAAMLGV
jgi:hypothetical protein